MKNGVLLFFFLLLSSSSTLLAQDKPHLLLPEVQTKQLSMNVTNFVMRFLTLKRDDNVFPGNNAVDLMYRVNKGEGKNSRVGFGVNFFYSKQNEDDDANSLFAFNIILGQEKYVDFVHRWRFFWGWQFDFGLDFRRQNFGFFQQDPVKTRGFNLGYSPLLGVQFAINNRLSISTEALYNILFRYQYVDEDEGFSFGGSFLTPQSVSLHYHF